MGAKLKTSVATMHWRRSLYETQKESAETKVSRQEERLEELSGELRALGGSPMYYFNFYSKFCWQQRPPVIHKHAIQNLDE